MLEKMLDVFVFLFDFAKILIIPVVILLAAFYLICAAWYVKLVLVDKKPVPPSGQVFEKKTPLLIQLLIQVPRRYVLDRLERGEGYFCPRGIHMFCGEQGCGKTIACVEMMQRLQRRYPAAKCISNFGLTTENDELKQWQQLPSPVCVFFRYS